VATGPRHFAFPFRFAGTGFATVEQDTADDITNCCAAVLAYPLGSRDERPDFGVAEQAFHDQGPDVIEIRQALQAWEPRAHTTVEISDADLMALTARVRVEVGTEG
jgi:phage baseplate assembly protein W